MTKQTVRHRLLAALELFVLVAACSRAESAFAQSAAEVQFTEPQPSQSATPEPVPTADGIGTVALVSGKANVRHGEVVTTNGKPEIQYSDAYERDLGPNDSIAPGDVIVTGGDSYLKIYYKDDSIMDVGPNSSLKVVRFDQGQTTRNIEFMIVEGKVRTLVTRTLGRGSSYRVGTPISSMSVHGTEWVTHAYQSEGQHRTDVTVLEGKVVVNVPRAGGSTAESVAVTPGRAFSGVGNGGTVSKFAVFKLTAPQMENMIALIPSIETKRGGAASITAALPGTGINTGRAPPGPTETASGEPVIAARGVAGSNPANAAIAQNPNAPATGATTVGGLPFKTIGGASGATAFLPRSGSKPGGGGPSPASIGATPGSPGGVAATAATAVSRPAAASVAAPPAAAAIKPHPVHPEHPHANKPGNNRDGTKH